MQTRFTSSSFRRFFITTFDRNTGRKKTPTGFEIGKTFSLAVSFPCCIDIGIDVLEIRKPPLAVTWEFTIKFILFPSFVRNSPIQHKSHCVRSISLSLSHSLFINGNGVCPYGVRPKHPRTAKDTICAALRRMYTYHLNLLRSWLHISRLSEKTGSPDEMFQSLCVCVCHESRRRRQGNDVVTNAAGESTARVAARGGPGKKSPHNCMRKQSPAWFVTSWINSCPPWG